MKKYKQMPFPENDEYVSPLLDNATRHAIKVCRAERERRRSVRTSVLRVALGAAASVALVLGIGWRMFLPQAAGQAGTATEVEQEQSPLDVFLDGITDEEAQTIACYEVEDIPEY